MSSSKGKIINLESDDHHEDLVDNESLHSGVVVYVFSASWCGPCKSFKPRWEKVSGAYPSIPFLYVDIDECPNLADQLGVSSIPAVRIYRPGKKVNYFEVKATEEDLRKNIEIAIK
jgi:thioredoxin 1